MGELQVQLDIPFDAALILDGTTLKTDHPDVWARYLNNRVLRFGRRVGAMVKTELGHTDLIVIRDYFSLWLNAQELIPADLREREDRRLLESARNAANQLSAVIDRHACETGCQVVHLRR